VFKKNSNFFSKSKGAFGFTEKCQFTIKTDRNSVFFGRDTHIPDRLYIMISHKITPMILPKIASLCQKLTKTPYFLVVTSLCRSIIHNGLVYEFLWSLKKLNIHPKSLGVSLRFYRNRQFRAKTDQNFVFLGRDLNVPNQLYAAVAYTSIYMF
jgi:hypothetical protein